MARPFDPGDSTTWCATLTLEQVAAIFQRSPEGIRHSCKPSSPSPFHPAPFAKHPLRWRKTEIVRVVEGRKVAA